MTQEQINLNQDGYNHTLHQTQVANEQDRGILDLYKASGAQLSKDGNTWACLLGVNLHDGICGFGDTPMLAIGEWWKAMNEN